MKRTLIKNLGKELGNEVTIKGWVDVARDQGKMAFFDFRDGTGKVQGVVFGKPDVLEIAKTLRPEWVVAVTGIVNERNDKNAKEFKEHEAQTGIRDFFIKDVELEITGFEILNKAETPVFEITESTQDTNEEVRLKNRYLDLRTERMQTNMRMRHNVAKLCRDYLDEQGFCELETPMLTKSTPEGARDYIVPSRLTPHNFYALPQSPQQYKQLLMSSGMERYFQFARCMRDEDLRGDRQPEFTQLDLDNPQATAKTIRGISPDIIVCTATRQSWWIPQQLPAPQASRFKSAGFGLWLPLHLDLPIALMRILHSADYRGLTLIAPFPDVVNCILDRMGLSPTCGIGNVDEIATKVRGLAAVKLSAPIDEVTVSLVGHHALEKCAFDGSREPVPYILRVDRNGRDVTKEVEATELLMQPFKLPKGPPTHFLTAGSAVRLITALGSDCSVRLHAPGPNGLPGGYPVLASTSGVTVPEIDGLSLPDAIDVNEQSHKFDGIERIEKDGSVVFTEDVRFSIANMYAW